MSKMLIGATLIVVVGAACARDRTQSTTEAAAAAPAQEITVIGCVQPADATATNEAGVNGTNTC